MKKHKLNHLSDLNKLKNIFPDSNATECSIIKKDNINLQKKFELYVKVYRESKNTYDCCLMADNVRFSTQYLSWETTFILKAKTIPRGTSIKIHLTKNDFLNLKDKYNFSPCGLDILPISEPEIRIPKDLNELRDTPYWGGI